VPVGHTKFCFRTLDNRLSKRNREPNSSVSDLPQHIVNPSWNPSTSGAVAYNVYRGKTSGGPYTEINPTLDPSITYTDSTVLGGQTYYYVSTALDASGVESGFSNEVEVTIPAP
jgi:fibronectin type 3 domain-containing protein